MGKRMNWKELTSVLTVGVLLGGTSLPAFAQKKKQQDSGPRETVAKPLSEKEQRKRAEKLRKELETPYRKWLNEDVSYIITDEERKAFRNMTTDEEREQFIEQFWLRRDPTPDSQENEYKEEHYRRIAYANERYASGIPGWKSDRAHLHHVRPARRNRVASFRRHLRASMGRGRRHDVHLPVREVGATAGLRAWART